MKNKSLKYFLFLLLISFSIIICGSESNYANTTEQITLSQFSVSDQSPEFGDTITFTFHIDAPKDKEIIDIQWSTKQGYGGDCGNGTQFHGTSSYDASMSNDVIYYGTWTIDYISVTCADGTTASFYDLDSDKVPDTLADNAFIVDMSGFDATVENDPMDTTAPVLNPNTITLSQPTANINESVTVAFNITDNVSVAYAWPNIKLGNGGLCAYGNLIYNQKSGLWETEIRTDYIGIYEFEYISVVDTSGNYTYIYNSEYSNIENSNIMEGAVLADLSAADFEVLSSNPDDQEGPQIDISSLNVKTENIGLWGNNEITLMATDDSDIVQVDVTMKQGQGGLCSYGGGFQYDAARDLYVCDVTGQYYGTWQIVDISAIDTNGNRTSIYNTAYGNYTPESDVMTADMSHADFDVGIRDDATDIFITGDGMDTDVTLDVSTLESNDIYDILIEEGYTKDTFVDIHVNGTYNKDKKKVKVKFKPKHGKDGDKIRIRHLLKDGTIQTHDAVIQDGYIFIFVDEFSPFLLERVIGSGDDENHELTHSQHIYNAGVMKSAPTCLTAGERIYTCTICGHTKTETIPATGYVKGAEFKKSNNTYTIKSVKGKKGTVVYEGTNKKTKNVKIPKTIKAGGKTYTVTEIAKDAFKNNTKLTTVTIPESVTKIGNNAFNGCKKLKTITIKSTKLKSVGKNAIKGINKKAIIKVQSKQLSKYKKLFKSRTGFKKTMKIKK